MELIKKKILLQNEELAYVDEGNGDVILFIHGNMSSSLHFKPLIERFCGDYRCVAMDLRGFGDSSYNQRFNSLKELAEDVKEFCDKLNITKAHIIGWSTGGGIALELAANYPELVKSVFSIEGAGHKGYPVFKKDKNFMPIIGEVYKTKEEMALDPIQVAPANMMLLTKNFEGMTALWDMVIYTVNKPSKEENAYYMNETLKQRNLVDIDWSLQISIWAIQTIYTATAMVQFIK